MPIFGDGEIRAGPDGSYANGASSLEDLRKRGSAGHDDSRCYLRLYLSRPSRLQLECYGRGTVGKRRDGRSDQSRPLRLCASVDTGWTAHGVTVRRIRPSPDQGHDPPSAYIQSAWQSP